MAEPVVTKDIEDVVSSVRRLVAPEASPRPLSRDLGAERLILTPSLRVVTDEDADRVQAALPVDPVTVPVEALEAGLPASDEVALPELHLHVVDQEWDNAFWTDTTKALEDSAEVSLVQTADADVDPVDLPDAADTGAAPVWVQDGADLDSASDASPASVVPFPQFAEARASLSAAKPDALSDGLDALSGLTDADGNPVTVIDEAALHDIVRNLIREELQGILGEKITQNVRKLVRAEINRALTARSLD